MSTLSIAQQRIAATQKTVQHALQTLNAQPEHKPSLFKRPRTPEQGYEHGADSAIVRFEHNGKPHLLKLFPDIWHNIVANTSDSKRAKALEKLDRLPRQASSFPLLVGKERMRAVASEFTPGTPLSKLLRNPAITEADKRKLEQECALLCKELGSQRLAIDIGNADDVLQREPDKRLIALDQDEVKTVPETVPAAVVTAYNLLNLERSGLFKPSTQPAIDALMHRYTQKAQALLKALPGVEATSVQDVSRPYQFLEGSGFTPVRIAFKQDKQAYQAELYPETAWKLYGNTANEALVERLNETDRVRKLVSKLDLPIPEAERAGFTKMLVRVYQVDDGPVLDKAYLSHMGSREKQHLEREIEALSKELAQHHVFCDWGNARNFQLRASDNRLIATNWDNLQPVPQTVSPKLLARASIANAHSYGPLSAIAQKRLHLLG